VVLEGLDEESVGVASLVGKLGGSSGDFGEPVLGPVLPADGVSDFLVDMLSVGFGLVEVGLVDVGNLGQIADHSGGDLFVSAVLLVSGNLDLEVLGLEVSQEVVDGLNSVVGSCSSLHDGGEFA
jgi:L-cystine uptake protein TcyP (sodium:dicarboxylate symporter family)